MKSMRKVTTELALIATVIASLVFVISAFTKAWDVLAWSGLIALIALALFLLLAKFDDNNYVQNLKRKGK